MSLNDQRSLENGGIFAAGGPSKKGSPAGFALNLRYERKASSTQMALEQESYEATPAHRYLPLSSGFAEEKSGFGAGRMDSEGEDEEG